MPNNVDGKHSDPSQGDPAKIGGFEIIEAVGKGGMGAVYRARQVSMDRLVALKILSSRLARNKTYVHRFVREARAAAKLNHPNIVQGIDVGKAGGCYYFAMEYIDGETTGDKVKRQGPLDEKEALDICLQTARALQHAHSRANIIHRDVKPQNILITSGGVAKLADLGLARHTEQADTSLTSTGVTLGTPDYISPEQIRGETDLDGRCDVYSLGATLYHLLTGKPPYGGESANVIMAKHLTEAPPDLAAERTDVSADTTAIVRKSMQKDRTKRYQTAEAMAAALEVVLRRPAEPEAAAPTIPAAWLREIARPKHVPAPGKSARALWIGAGVIVALGVLVAFLLNEKGVTVPETPPVTLPPSRPKEKPPERPKPTEPKVSEPDRGERTYQRARELVRENAERPWRIILYLGNLLEECRGTKYEKRVALLRNNALKEHRTVAKAGLAELNSRADALWREKRYGEAIDVYTEVPEALEFGGWPAKVDEARDPLRRKANEAYARSEKAARAAADAGQYDKAILTIAEVSDWGLPEFERSARRLIETFKAEKAQAQRRAEKERHAALIDHMGKVLSAVKGRQFATAASVAGKASLDKALGEEAARFERLQEDIKTLESLWHEAEQRLQKMKPGDNVRLGGIMRKFVSFQKGTVTAHAAGVSKTVKLSDMSDVDLFELLGPYFEANDDKPEAHFRRGLFYTFDKCRRLDEARRSFDKVQELGGAATAERGRHYIKLISQIEPEHAAVALLAEARTALKKGLWEELAEKLNQLREYRETQTFKDSANERTKLMLLAAGNGRGLGALFTGQAALEGADALTITYDLRQETQRGDWRGGSSDKKGLRFYRQLRWNAGVKIASVRLVLAFPERVEQTELRIMTTPQGGDPLVTVLFGAYRGTRADLLGQRGGAIRTRIGPRIDTVLDVGITGTEAMLSINGGRALRVPIAGRRPGGRSILLISNGVPVDVTGVTVAGRLDLDWARRRAAELADIAGGRLLKTVAVPAGREWTDTGITLSEGERYHLRATGRWQYGRASANSVSGAGGPTLYRYMPAYSLIAEAGGSTFPAGEEATLGPYVSGRLRLGMNEWPGGHRDNSGKLTVEVRLLPHRPAPRLVPGLLTTYYDGIDFGEFKNAKISPMVNFRAAEITEAAGQAENFSVRWEGYMKISAAGAYEFGFNADDACRLWVDGKKVLDNWTDRFRRPMDRSLQLLLGRGLHKIKLEYFQTTDNAFMRLRWRRDRRRSELVPADAFFHPADRAQELGIR